MLAGMVVGVKYICVWEGAEYRSRSLQFPDDDGDDDYDVDDDDDLRNNSLHLGDTQNEVVLLGSRVFLLL